MLRQAKPSREGQPWYKRYRGELGVLIVMALIGLGVWWSTRSVPPEADNVLSALREYAAFSTQDGTGAPPAVPADMTLGELAARTQHVRILETKPEGSYRWLVDAVVLATWSENEMVNFKLQFRMRQKGTAWIITDARKL